MFAANRFKYGILYEVGTFEFAGINRKGQM